MTSQSISARSFAYDVKATTYTVNLIEPMHEWITVVLTCVAGGGPHKPPEDTWAVRKGALCLNEAMEWEYEPIPSSRDEDFYSRTRWDLDEAIEHAVYMANQEARRRDVR